MQVPVVSLAVGIDGCRLAALAADGSAFFLLLDATALQQSLATTQQQQSSGSTQQQQQQQQQLAPLVSCQLGISSVSCCCWYVGGTKLLVGTSSGVALEVEVPQPGSIDTSRCVRPQLRAQFQIPVAVHVCFACLTCVQSAQQLLALTLPPAVIVVATAGRTSTSCLSSASRHGRLVSASSSSSSSRQTLLLCRPRKQQQVPLMQPPVSRSSSSQASRPSHRPRSQHSSSRQPQSQEQQQQHQQPGLKQPPLQPFLQQLLLRALLRALRKQRRMMLMRRSCQCCQSPGLPTSLAAAVTPFCCGWEAQQLGRWVQGAAVLGTWRVKWLLLPELEYSCSRQHRWLELLSFAVSGNEQHIVALEAGINNLPLEVLTVLDACSHHPQVLTCSWGTQPPSAISSTVAVAGAAVSVCSRSWSGAYQLTGTSDGQVRLEEVGPAPR
jgi:hypothetical protein